jgi:hypothetical protein
MSHTLPFNKVVGGVFPCVGNSALVLKPGLRAAYRFSAKSLPWTPPTRLHSINLKSFGQKILYRVPSITFLLGKPLYFPVFSRTFPLPELVM